MSEMEMAVCAIERMCEICFNGRLPAREHDAPVIAALMSVLTATVLENAEPEIIAKFSFEFIQALDILRRERATRWMN